MDLLILSIYGLSYWLASIPNITFHTEKRRASKLARGAEALTESMVIDRKKAMKLLSHPSII